MKASLLFRDHDFDLQMNMPPNEQTLAKDLELNTLFGAMALGDEFLFEGAKNAVLSGLKNDPETIIYRQDIIKDCLKNPSITRRIYNIAAEAVEGEKKAYYLSFFSRYPDAILSRSIEVLTMFVDRLQKIKKIGEEHADKYESEGFTRFFAMLKKELSDEYFEAIQRHLRELKFSDGVLMSAELGKGIKGINYTLRKTIGKKKSWIERIFIPRTPAYSYNIAPRDESGARALSELKGKGITLVANALAQSTDHILSFFTMLRNELAFYVGCVNLHEQLVRMGEPASFPEPAVSIECGHSFRGLYDVCLALTMKRKIVGNDMSADGNNIVIITGANEGGKSTFLRSVGLAQLMMQCGMFVPADAFSSGVYDSLFTHFKREEDMTIKSGKLDEELKRMSEIVDRISPNTMLLLNESFAATNEREGSEIARQIICALKEKRVTIFYVTHLYEFALGIYEKNAEKTIFLRAERQTDGGRTYKILTGKPLPTSYGRDLYGLIFGTDRENIK